MPCSFLTELLFTFQTMGPWCTLKLTYLFIDEMDKLILNIPYPIYKLLLEVAQTRLRIFQKKLHEVINDDNTYETLIKFSSPKLLRLVELLEYNYRDYEKLNEDGNQNGSNVTQQKSSLSAIVFVQRRHTACVLDGFLKEVRRRNSEFSHIQSCFLIGTVFPLLHKVCADINGAHLKF